MSSSASPRRPRFLGRARPGWRMTEFGAKGHGIFSTLRNPFMCAGIFNRPSPFWTDRTTTSSLTRQHRFDLPPSSNSLKTWRRWSLDHRSAGACFEGVFFMGLEPARTGNGTWQLATECYTFLEMAWLSEPHPSYTQYSLGGRPCR
jgi:hypothetical protein